MKTPRLAGILAPLVALASAPARVEASTCSLSSPVVYDETAGRGTPRDLPHGSTRLDILIDSGRHATSLVGTPCSDGDGGELCAVDLNLTISGPGNIAAFDPPAAGPAIVFAPTALPTEAMRLNLLQSISPPAPSSPQYLGAVWIAIEPNASASNPVVVNASGQFVNAAGDLCGFDSGTIAKAMPEPSLISVLLSGALALTLMHRSRRHGVATGRARFPRDPN